MAVNLVASLVVRNELGRYLEPCIEHLLEFCDEVAIVNDGSTDGTAGWLYGRSQNGSRLHSCNTAHVFFKHEGRARQWLLDWTLLRKPTHVLPVDADEFISNGTALRALIEEQPEVRAWHIPIEEVWHATDERYMARVDGGWNMGRTLCWKVPPGRLTFPNRALACGRVPAQVRILAARPAAMSLLHCGWLDEADRVARAARYTKHDGGRFHANAHLQSILWPPEKIALRASAWPAALAPCKHAILEHARVAA